MMKSILLATIVALFSASSILLADAEGDVPPAVSAKVRRAAAAGIPKSERKLQASAPTCYVLNTQINFFVQTSCDNYHSCGPFFCCSDETACYNDGKASGSNGFLTVSLNDNSADCSFNWGVCS